MTVSTTKARHRAARRPSTPLSDLAVAATGQIGVVTRRTAVVAASSGLVVSMLATPAMAAPQDQSTTGALSAVDTDVLTVAAHAALEAAPTVTAPADATWTFDAPAVTAVEPVVVVQRTTSTSRSSTRTSTTATTTSDATSVAPPASVSGNAVLEIAAQYVGTPYVSGGSTPSGFDCSGFTSYVFAQLGISLPRTSSAQHYAGTIISAADAQPGDLVWSPGHIAIYAGGNTMIDSPRPGKSVQFRAMWQSNPVFIRIG